MVGEIAAGLGLFKSMMDVAQRLKSINDAAVRNTAVIELQEKILAAQMQQASLIEHVGKLEKRVAGFETWDREKERYQLTKLPPGVFVYVLKEEAGGTEPPHYLCAKCYEDRRKSILNSDEPKNGRTKWHCPSCGFEDHEGYYRRPNVSSYRGIS